MRWSQWLTGARNYPGPIQPWGPGFPWLARELGDAAGFDSMAAVNRTSGPVFSCITARLLVLSEARLQWQRLNTRDELFGTADLALLEEPWPSGTTGDLIARMEQTASLSGNFYCTIADDAGNFGKTANGPGRRIAVMDPTRVRVIWGSPGTDDEAPNPHALNAKILGYEWDSGFLDEKVILPASDVVHYSPIPDPEAPWRGMSWITPILSDVEADLASTRHKGKFFQQGASPSMVGTLPPQFTAHQVKEFSDVFNAQYGGSDNAYRTVFMGGGADLKPLTVDLKNLDFKNVQGGGETRIAAAAGVPPVIAGFSEGLASATYSNYAQARRRMTDGTLRPLWRMMCGALQKIVTPPAGSRLWYDDRDIAFVREDRKDLTDIQSAEAATIRNLADGGFDPASAVEAVMSGDWKRLKHTGKLSVQLQEPGANDGKTNEP